MDFLNNIVALILPIWLFLVKEYIPYKIKKYAAKKDDGTYNEEKLVDVKKEFHIALLLFPSDLLIISAGYIVAKIFACSKAIVNTDLSSMIEELTIQLNTNHILFSITLFLILPLYVLGTRKSVSLIFPKKNISSKKALGIIISTVLYIFSAGFILLLLINN